MIRLGCVLGRLGNTPLPPFLDNGAAALPRYFDDASGGDIQLVVDDSRLNQSLGPDRPDYAALDLHQAQLMMTHNPPPPVRSERIAVLFANHYAPHHGVLGMMFDRGFATWDDPNTAPMLTGSPREGCAIFLQAILALRGGGIAAQQEALFTTIHEMGHLFNLQHSPAGAAVNFMATSKPRSVFPPPYRFLDSDSQQLRHCSTSPNVWPGGTHFADTGDWSSGAQMVKQSVAVASGLELKLVLPRFEFWRFEPVELEIELSVAPGLERSYDVPDMVDPGYRQFSIWLETPTGERRRYRSPRHYCAAPSRRRIAPGRPLRRDISIFGESGGYTFRQSGAWRLWAEFDAGPGRLLRSNCVDINIRSARGDERYQATARCLSDRASAALLYHRIIRNDLSGVATLEGLLDADPIIPVGGIEYALGRALTASHSDQGRANQTSTGIELLRRARDRPEIGEVQRSHADRIISGRRRAAPPTDRGLQW